MVLIFDTRFHSQCSRPTQTNSNALVPYNINNDIVRISQINDDTNKSRGQVIEIKKEIRNKDLSAKEALNRDF